MTTGYAYDVTRNGSYDGITKSHAGIDYQVGANKNVSVVVPGTIINVAPDYKGIGQFVTVLGKDGKRWIYGHINASKLKGRCTDWRVDRHSPKTKALTPTSI
jgi:hypothetical protein